MSRSRRWSSEGSVKSLGIINTQQTPGSVRHLTGEISQQKSTKDCDGFREEGGGGEEYKTALLGRVYLKSIILLVRRISQYRTLDSGSLPQYPRLQNCIKWPDTRPRCWSHLQPALKVTEMKIICPKDSSLMERYIMSTAREFVV